MDKNTSTLKERFVEQEGYWSDDLEQVLRGSPGYFAAYMNLMAVPAKTGRLDPKTREFVSISINAAATHLNAPNMRIHMEKALRLGATREEITEVCQLAAVLGTHSMSIGIPVLIDEFRKAGRIGELDLDNLSPAEEALKADFVNKRGYWLEHNQAILKLCPEYFVAYKDYSSYPWLNGTLEPKVREFIYIAIDVSTTHLYELGLRVHMRNALGHGATAGEIVDVFLVTSLLGLQTNTMAFPILNDVLEA